MTANDSSTRAVASVGRLFGWPRPTALRLATPMEASGECDDAPVSDREPQPSPELTVSVADHRLVIEHLAGPETARTGTWTAHQTLCQLPEAPPTPHCEPTD